MTFSASVMEASHGVTRICHSPSNLLRPSPMTQLPTDTGCQSGSVLMSPGNWGRRMIRPAGHPSERGADNSSLLFLRCIRPASGAVYSASLASQPCDMSPRHRHGRHHANTEARLRLLLAVDFDRSLQARPRKVAAAITASSSMASVRTPRTLRPPRARSNSVT